MENIRVDVELVGCWRVKSIDIFPYNGASIIAGAVGEIVEFTEGGRYLVDLKRVRPASYGCRTHASGALPELDIWMADLWNAEGKPFVSRCVYEISGSQLTICIAAGCGERPTELRRDDERFWCVKTFERTAKPKRRKRKRVKPMMEPGSLIPEAFLDKRSKR